MSSNSTYIGKVTATIWVTDSIGESNEDNTEVAIAISARVYRDKETQQRYAKDMVAVDTVSGKHVILNSGDYDHAIDAIMDAALDVVNIDTEEDSGRDGELV